MEGGRRGQEGVVRLNETRRIQMTSTNPRRRMGVKSSGCKRAYAIR
jgi:hypothetical protein